VLLLPQQPPVALPKAPSAFTTQGKGRGFGGATIEEAGGYDDDDDDDDDDDAVTRGPTGTEVMNGAAAHWCAPATRAVLLGNRHLYLGQTDTNHTLCVRA
jgi:hypothetical protein